MNKITQILSCFLIASALSAQELIINNFEDEKEVATWRQSQVAMPDSHPCRVAFTDALAYNGKGSMEIVLPKHESGKPMNSLLEASVDNRALKQISWSDYRYLCFELYLKNAKSTYVRMRIADIENHVFGRRLDLNRGWNRITIPLELVSKAGVNVGRIGSLCFYHEFPVEDIVLNLDHMRLSVDGDAPDWANLGTQLRKDAESLNQTSSELQQTAALLKQSVVAKPNRQELEKELTEKRCQLTSMFQKNIKSLHSYTTAQPERFDAEALNMGLFSKQIAAWAAEAKLLQQIKDNYINPDFVIGQQVFPDTDNIRYSPRCFEGPLIRQLELTLAANEKGFSCLVVIPVKADLKNFQIKSADLVNDKGLRIKANQLKIAPLAYRIENQDEAYGFLLRPDINAVNIPQHAQHAFWLTVKVPSTASAGVYRGELFFAADNIQAIKLPLSVRVRPFQLPAAPSLPLINTSRTRIWEPDSLDIIDHRCEPGSLYSPEFSPKRMIEWVKNGARYINILHVDRQGKDNWHFDKKGKLVSLAANKKEQYNNALTTRLGIIKSQYPDLLDKIYVYGFDEPNLREIPALNDIHRELKEKYGIKTMFATYLPIWEREEILYADYWAVQSNILTPENMAYIRKHCEKIFAYNLNSDGPIARFQFWSAYKSKLDGLLHYTLNSARDKTSKEDFPLLPATRGGVRMPDLPKMKNFNTVGFELWLRGSQDHDYMVILQNLIQAARQQTGLRPEQFELLGKAAALLEFPDDCIPLVYNLNRTKGCDFEFMDRRISEIGDMIETLQKEFQGNNIIPNSVQ